MSGKTDDRFFAQDFSGIFASQIVLPEMNAVGFESQSDIDAIVYDNFYAAFARDLERFFCVFVKILWR